MLTLKEFDKSEIRTLHGALRLDFTCIFLALSSCCSSCYRGPSVFSAQQNAVALFGFSFCVSEKIPENVLNHCGDHRE